MTRPAAFLLLLVALPLFAADRYIIEFRGTPRVLASDAITAAAHRKAFSRLRSDVADSGTVEHEYSMTFLGAAVCVRPDALPRLRALPYVAGVYEDATLRAHADGTVHDAGARVNALSLPTRGKGITIAILDSGVDYHHPAIRPNYAGGYDFVNRDGDPMDDNGHGTHVAGIAAGRSDDVVGVASEAAIVAYKVLDANGIGFYSDFVAALERAVDPNQDGDATDRVDVVNMSFGASEGTADHPLARAVDNVVAAGVVVAVSAGNSGSSFGTITTPANARRAITVASLDTAGITVAFFSSRGPTTSLMTFKPDLAAPGQAVVSAKLGGGTIAQSGTSVAAPHVAGAAALLLALHPDWTPDQVKSALVRSAAALTLTNDVFSRGTGKLDVAPAASATLVVSESGLSFGGNGALEGTRTETRRFTITNRGSRIESLTLSAADTPNGCAVTITPPALDLAPGQSADVTVQVAMDNTAMRPPALTITGGDVVVSGTSSFRIPWALVRAARATIRYDGELVMAAGFGDRTRQAVKIDSSSAELWLPANLSQDLTILGGSDTETRRVISVERRIAGDETVDFTKAQATLKLELSGRDHEGRRLADLPRVAGRSEQYVRLRVSSGSTFFADVFDGVREILMSQIPSRLKIDVAEVFLDVDAMRGYVVQQKSLLGLSASAVLTNEPYVHARLRWPRNAFVAACYAFGAIAGSTATYPAERCLNGDGELFDLYTTPEPNADSFVAMLFAGSGFETPPFRASNGTIVATGEVTPATATHRIAHNSEVSVGTGPFVPFATVEPVPRFIGPLGEEHYRMTADAFVTTHNGVQLVAPATVARRNARVEVDVQSSAPTITSLQILGTSGNPTETLQRGDAASLRLAAADFTSDVRANTPKAASAWFRIAGTKDWRALSLTRIASETGERATLKHLPSGDVYIADLRDATAVDNVAIDLRVEVEDNAGNRVTWTQEPAFVVGNPAMQPRRRSAR